MSIDKTDKADTQKRRLVLKIERFKELTPAELGKVHGANSLNCNAAGCKTDSSIECVRDND